jgi:hypothetical protein
MIAATMYRTIAKRVNHQYSERRARPEKVTYLLRQVRTLSAKLMAFSLSW